MAPLTEPSAALLDTLPQLDEMELERLRLGKRVQRQRLAEDGSGTGFAVCDVCADADMVWEAVKDFDGYAERIKTVRTVTPYVSEAQGSEGEPCYSFLVSRIRLVLNVRFTIDETRRRVAWQVADRPTSHCLPPGCLLALLPGCSGMSHLRPLPARAA